jgi:hypothetical protein
MALLVAAVLGGSWRLGGRLGGRSARKTSTDPPAAAFEHVASFHSAPLACAHIKTLI